jgi:peptidoglycan/LPS O-acetylase OafA/YrhL
MLAEYKSKTVTFVVAGIVLQMLGGILAKAGFLGWLVGAPAGLLGSVLLIMGCCFYAKAKGYAWWVGLLGLLSCIGLVVLYFLPDQHK